VTLQEIKDTIGVKPYYETELGVLYCADCLNIMQSMPEKCVDLVLTDPPYGIGEAAGKNKSRGCLAVSKDYGNEDWDNSPMSSNQKKECQRISLNQIFFGGNYFDLPPSPC